MSDSGYLMQTALPYGLHGLNDASFVQYTHALLVSVRSLLFLPLYAIVPVLASRSSGVIHGASRPAPISWLYRKTRGSGTTSVIDHKHGVFLS